MLGDVGGARSNAAPIPIVAQEGTSAEDLLLWLRHPDTIPVQPYLDMI